jgi:hypothetical protein
MRNLFGDPVPVQYAVDATRQPELFTESGGTGSAWMRAAEAWAEANGQRITRWAADQRFEAGGQGYAVTWDGERWHVRTGAF